MFTGAGQKHWWGSQNIRLRKAWPSLGEEKGSLFPHPLLQIPTMGMR